MRPLGLCVVGVVLGLAFLASGCGVRPEFDRAAAYTPESLAQEAVFRYRGLNPEARKSTRKTRVSKAKTAAERESEETATRKNQGAPTTKKRSGAATLDDLLDDLSTKLDRIAGLSRADACKKLVEAVASDPTLGENDRKSFSARLQELAGAP